jgi:hypothetical protein
MEMIHLILVFQVVDIGIRVFERRGRYNLEINISILATYVHKRRFGMDCMSLSISNLNGNWLFGS